jgi:hypothetical protein
MSTTTEQETVKTRHRCGDCGATWSGDHSCGESPIEGEATYVDLLEAAVLAADELMEVLGTTPIHTVRYSQAWDGFEKARAALQQEAA